MADLLESSWQPCGMLKVSPVFWPIADLIASVVPPGLFFGRIANFINGELWGRKQIFPGAFCFLRHQTLLWAPVILLKYMLHYKGLIVFIYVQFRF